MRLSFLPREEKFFLFLQQSAENLKATSVSLLDLMENYEDIPEKVAEIKRLEGKTLYLWERRDVEGTKEEPFQPPLSELVHTVRISTTPGYLIGHRAARSRLMGRHEKAQEIEGLASLLAFDLKSRDEKINAVYNYVQEKIEHGGWGGGNGI